MSALVDELRAPIQIGTNIRGEPIFGTDPVRERAADELTTLQSRLEAEKRVNDVACLKLAAAEARVEELQRALAHCDVICAHALEHYKGPVAMKIKREIAVHVRATLSPARSEEGKP